VREDGALRREHGGRRERPDVRAEVVRARDVQCVCIRVEPRPAERAVLKVNSAIRTGNCGEEGKQTHLHRAGVRVRALAGWNGRAVGEIRCATNRNRISV